MISSPLTPCGFNPTLVRLRQQRVSSLGYRFCPFQSHAGSIEAIQYYYNDFTAEQVSIPRWFD